jgi:hypothetical protein
MSTISDFGIPGVGSGGLLHPKHQDRWRVIFNKIGGDGIDSKNLSFQAVKVSRPTLTFQEIELHRYNTRAWIAGKHEWNDCELTIEDDLTGTASKIIQSQLQRQKWLIGTDGAWLSVAPEGSLYKFSMQLEMMDGAEFVLERWYLEGSWIKVANYGELNYEENGKVTIALTVRYDHARQELYQYASGQGVATGGAAGSAGGGLL